MSISTTTTSCLSSAARAQQLHHPASRMDAWSYCLPRLVRADVFGSWHSTIATLGRCACRRRQGRQYAAANARAPISDGLIDMPLVLGGSQRPPECGNGQSDQFSLTVQAQRLWLSWRRDRTAAWQHIPPGVRVTPILHQAPLPVEESSAGKPG